MVNTNVIKTPLIAPGLKKLFNRVNYLARLRGPVIVAMVREPRTMAGH
jgi:hypothetical protein